MHDRTTTIPKRFMRFRRDAEGHLTFFGLQSLSGSTSAPDILLWQDRGIAAIWDAAGEMEREAAVWKKALEGAGSR